MSKTETSKKEAEGMQQGTVSGSCICGKVHYECTVKSSSVGIVYCHCTDCQQAHTAPYVGAFLVPESDVTWSEGSLASMLHYNRRGTNVRLFCKTCGVHMACHKTPYHMYAIFPSSVTESTLPIKR